MARRRRAAARPDRMPAPASAPRGSAGQWIYGRHAVAAALANPARRVRRVVALSESAETVTALLKEGRAVGPAAPEILDRRALESLLPAGAVHQGIAIETETLEALDLEDLLGAIPETGAPHILILLDQVTDPHNVGAILRSAAAFGALAVIVPEHGAPQVTGALAKAASGALEAVPLLRVTNLVRCLERLKEAGFWCVGLDTEAPQSIATLDLPERVALVLGAEGAGLRRLVREHCDFLAHLPTRGKLASLNVSNAAAVALYALTQGGGAVKT
ncbi:MAG TPA: 23S rRNA (guanosine(2251)-2'-O)-methyltransferase RlmB [Stellaceae bacterium]|nr:23S rRNA (guanosine(2251)-2'-O)-methyltransferase RlmB [Stellaceae bacterium]